MKKILPISLSRLSGPMLAAIAAILIAPHNAFAQVASSMGDVLCNVSNNMTPFLNVFDMIAYVAGAVFIVQGVLHLKSHQENPGQHPHHKSFAMLFAGAALTALPSFAGMVVDTLFGVGGSGPNGLSVCLYNLASVSGGAGPVGLDVMMTNMMADIKDPLIFVTSATAAILGLFLIIRGLMKAAKYGTDARTSSITGILSNLIIGAILITIATSASVILDSVFGTTGIATLNSVNWTAIQSLGGDTSAFTNAMKAALTFFQIVGLISFVRGWNVIRNAVEGTGQATVAQGLTHIIGGVLAINIYTFIEVMNQTFGTNFVS